MTIPSPSWASGIVAFLRQHARPLTIGLVIGLFAYFFIVPRFWPRPHVRVEIPDVVTLGTDDEITIVVQSWHPNIIVADVRFMVDYADDVTAVTPDDTLYPFSLYRESRERRRWGYWELNRMTWPRSKRITCVIPIEELTNDGTLQPGVLRGKVEVDMRYPGTRMHQSAGLFGYHMRNIVHATPYTIEVR